jgi:hypothetical protein
MSSECGKSRCHRHAKDVELTATFFSEHRVLRKVEEPPGIRQRPRPAFSVRPGDPIFTFRVEIIPRAKLIEVVKTVRLVMVPRVGVEPTRPYGQRILSLKETI